MVRKQLNIAPEQDEVLKRLAADRGISESELVREAIDHFIGLAREDAEREERVRRLHELYARWDRMPFERTPSQKGYRLGCYDDIP